MQTNQVRVGVGVLIVRDGRVLLGKRAGSHGAGTWAPPGGHLDVGESIAACAAREVLEETGLVVEETRAGPYTSDVFVAENRHYITLFVVARCSGEPALLEPDKCTEWGWYRWTDLPAPLFQSLANLHATGFVPDNAA